MKTNGILFWILGIFFLVAAAVYTIWAAAEYNGEIEWVGTVALALTGVFGIFLGFFMTRTASSFGGVLPEDRLDANIDDGDPEVGHFAPWSWWPFALGCGVFLTGIGLCIGIWLFAIGAALGVVALVGFVFEHYRGNFAR